MTMPLCWACGKDVGYEDDMILARLTEKGAEFAHIRCVPEAERVKG